MIDMRFKEDFLRELSRRLKENLEIIESSFELSNKDKKILEENDIKKIIKYLVKQSETMKNLQITFQLHMSGQHCRPYHR